MKQFQFDPVTDRPSIIVDSPGGFNGCRGNENHRPETPEYRELQKSLFLIESEAIETETAQAERISFPRAN